MSFARKKDFSGMNRSEILQSAKERIYRSAAAAEQSTNRLQAKMEANGYPSEIINEALDHACSLGIIDNRRYSECLIRSTIASGRGLSKAEREIQSLGIDIETLDAYQEYIDRGEDAQIQDAIEFLERHPSKAKDKYGSSFRKLVSRGYSSRIASQATRRYFEDNERNDEV